MEVMDAGSLLDNLTLAPRKLAGATAITRAALSHVAAKRVNRFVDRNSSIAKRAVVFLRTATDRLPPRRTELARFGDEKSTKISREKTGFPSGSACKLHQPPTQLTM